MLDCQRQMLVIKVKLGDDQEGAQEYFGCGRSKVHACILGSLQHMLP